MTNKPDMRRVTAEALLKQLEQRDPKCLNMLFEAMTLFAQAYPQLGLKDFMVMAMRLLPTAALTEKEKEFLCPNLLAGKTEAAKQSPSRGEITIAA